MTFFATQNIGCIAKYAFKLKEFDAHEEDFAMLVAMKVLLQRVKQASVEIDGETVGSIQKGYLLFVGILQGDTSAHAQLLAEKVVKLRLFEGPDGKINDQSLLDIQGELLVISQFTLAGSTEKGNRPDYTAAARPGEAEMLYDYFVSKLEELQVKRVETGKFGAMMQVHLINDGPVTLLLEK